MRYNRANGFKRSNLIELKYDLIDVMYYCLIYNEITDDPNLALTYEALNHDAATALTWIDALENGLAIEYDMTDEAIKLVTSTHAVSMMIIDFDILQGDRYEEFCIRMRTE